MTDTLVIRVDWTPPASLSPNSRVHWRGKHPDQQGARALTMHAARAAIRAAPDWCLPAQPVLDAVIAWGKGGRRRDSDNALNSLKHSIDGMCAALGFDDKQFLTSRAFQRRDPDKRGYVEFIIRPATDDERRLTA